MKGRITDICINDMDVEWELYIPLKSGHLEVRLRKETQDPWLNRFFETAMSAEFRRFGENPQ